VKESNLQFSDLFPEIANFCSGGGVVELGRKGPIRNLIKVYNEGGDLWRSPENMKSIDDCLDLLEKDIGLFNDDPGSFFKKDYF